MSDTKREITYQNVLKLAAALESERGLRMDLQKRVDAMQAHVNQMTVDLAGAKAKASAALAMSRGGGATAG